MSEIGKPKECINGCDRIIYFDKNSSVGHPTTDKWIPLEYKSGLRVDTIHECSKKPRNVLLQGNAVKIDNLAVIKQIADALYEYIAIKEGR
jgi:hypothetical protein